MKGLKHYILISMLFSPVIVLTANSQSINGDTIYVNSKVEVAVQFPSMPSSFFTNPVDAPYNIRTLGTGFTIIAKSKNTPPARLSVMEGKRSHSFIILYKRNISIANKKETYIDYSSLKQLEAHINQKETERNIEGKYAALVVSAKKNTNEKKYEAAKADYEEILKLKPRDKNANRELKKINKQLNADASAKPTKETEASQFYSDKDLKEKYPDFNFTRPPEEQQFDLSNFDNKKVSSGISAVLAEKPRLSISDDSRKIKITCLGLSFKNKVVYMKLLIENKSKKDFLTGSFLLSWDKKSGDPQNLLPVDIHPNPFPVVKSRNEAIVVYIFKPANIADSDKLNLEVTDRYKKLSIKIKIKGSFYTEESIRHF